MGAGGVPSGGTFIYYDLHHLPEIGKDNSRSDFYYEGKLKVQRWYDSDGKLEHERHFFHSGPGPFPHDHIWYWDENGPHRDDGHLPPDYDNYY